MINDLSANAVHVAVHTSLPLLVPDFAATAVKLLIKLSHQVVRATADVHG